MKKSVISIVLAAVMLLSACSSGGDTNGSAATTEDPATEMLHKTVVFGHYEQDRDKDNGPEPIEWEVLAVEDGNALLISKNLLDSRQYYSGNNGVTWEKSDIRVWLNNPFYNRAFDESEKEQIQTVTISNPDNSSFGTAGGNDTEDKVFLLSIDEAESLFADDQARAIAPGWWLRSPGGDADHAACISEGGSVFTGGRSCHDHIGVRPAIWVNVNAILG